MAQQTSITLKSSLKTLQSKHQAALQDYNELEESKQLPERETRARQELELEKRSKEVLLDHFEKTAAAVRVRSIGTTLGRVTIDGMDPLENVSIESITETQLVLRHSQGQLTIPRTQCPKILKAKLWPTDL